VTGTSTPGPEHPARSRMRRELRRAGIVINHKRVRRLTRAHGLAAGSGPARVARRSPVPTATSSRTSSVDCSRRGPPNVGGVRTSPTSPPLKAG
jgi:hypothetical protein